MSNASFTNFTVTEICNILKEVYHFDEDIIRLFKGKFTLILSIPIFISDLNWINNLSMQFCVVLNSYFVSIIILARCFLRVNSKGSSSISLK